MSRSRRGFTLVELMLATTLFAIVGGVVVELVQRSSGAYEAMSSSVQTKGKARRTIERVKGLLRGVGWQQITPILSEGSWVDELQFQTVVGQTDGVPVWSDVHRLRLVQEPTDPLDGIDNDGDDLVDERQLEWTQAFGAPEARTRVLARGVAALGFGEELNGKDDDGDGLTDEPGACFSYTGQVVVFDLTLLQSDGAGNAVPASYQTAVQVLDLGDE